MREYVKINTIWKRDEKGVIQVVGRTSVPLFDRRGDRIMAKVKTKDYQRQRLAASAIPVGASAE